jgi:hypothetical protein
MRHLLAIGSIALLLATMAQAYPALTGPTGQFVIPTAEISPPGAVLAADWQRLEVGASIPMRVQLCFGPSIEVGALYDPFDQDAPIDKAWAANAKVQMGRVLLCMLALGGQFRREDRGGGPRTDYDQAYAVWSSDFSSGGENLSNLKLTWGVNWTQANTDGATVIDGFRYFAGAKLRFTNAIELMAEYQTKSKRLGDLDPVTAFGGRFAIGHGLWAEAGVTNAIGLSAGKEQNLFAGLALEIGAPTDPNAGVEPVVY